MKHLKLFAFPVFALLLFVFAVSSANGVGAYTQLPTIAIPGNINGGFDITFYDPGRDRIYFSDAKRGGGAIEAIDARTGTFLFSIGGFTGFDPTPIFRGPNGVLVTNGNEAWAGDGNTTVKVMDLDAQKITDTIDISKPGGNIPDGTGFRANELTFDPLDRIIVIGVSAPVPYVAFIDQNGPAPHRVLGYLGLPDATNGGIDAPIWDPASKKIYYSAPNSNANPLAGDLLQIDPVTRKVTAVYRGPCRFQGIVLLPGSRVMTSCGAVFDLKTGAVLAGQALNPNGTPVTADEIWYNPSDDRVYFGNNQGTVIDASTYDLVRMSGNAVRLGLQQAPIDSATYQLVTSLFGFPLPVGQTGAQVGVFGGHTVAVSSSNNHVFFPVGNVGVKVFAEN